MFPLKEVQPKEAPLANNSINSNGFERQYDLITNRQSFRLLVVFSTTNRLHLPKKGPDVLYNGFKEFMFSVLSFMQP